MRRWVWVLIVVAAGCGGGDDDDAVPDAAVADATVVEADGEAADATLVDAALIDALTIVTPMPPRIAPCAAGWREVIENGVTTCDPWPATGAATCTGNQVQLPGTVGCATLGTPCGAGDWATDLPAATIIYVRPGTGNQNGSMAAPYHTINQALLGAGSNSGTVIAVAKGSYTESNTITVPAGVTLWGACDAETVIQSPGAGQIAVFMKSGSRLRNLRLSGANMLEVDATNTSAALLERVVVDQPAVTMPSVLLLGPTLADGLLVRGTRTSDRVIQIGEVSPTTGIVRVTLDRFAFLTGVMASYGRVNINDAVMTGTLSILREGVSIRRSSTVGISTRGDVLVEDSVVGLTGVQATDVGIASLRRVTVKSIGGALTAFNDASLFVTDVLVRGGTSRGGDRAYAIAIEHTSEARLSRVHVVDARHCGVASFGSGSRIQGSDVTITRTLPPECAATFCPELAGVGLGLATYGGSTAELTRLAIVGNAMIGVQIGVGSAIDLHQGRIGDQPIGANIEQPGFAVSRLTDEVYFMNNSVNVESVSLPLPPPPMLDVN